jgi:voltage-gated potassium channel
VFFFLFPRAFRSRLRDREPLLRLIDFTLALLLACAGMAVSYRMAEASSWPDAFWLMWQTVTTVGYGDVPPKSGWGRLGVGVFGLAAIITLAPAIGAAFEYRQECRDRRRRGMMDNPHRNGYVLFNFPGYDSCLSLLRQLRIVEPDTPVCIVDSALEELPSAIASIRNIHFLRGSLLEKETYRRAGVAESKAVIVYPQDRAKTESDGTTRTVLEMLSGFVGPQTRMIHVLLDPDHEWLFHGSGSAGVYADMESLALVQEIQGRYTAQAIEHLLLNTHGADPVTVQPRRIVGWTWRDLRLFSVQAVDFLGIGMNLLALVQNGQPETCPANDAVIQEGDMLLVTLPHGTALEWARFEEALIGCKKGHA